MVLLECDFVDKLVCAAFGHHVSNAICVKHSADDPMAVPIFSAGEFWEFCRCQLLSFHFLLSECLQRWRTMPISMKQRLERQHQHGSEAKERAAWLTSRLLYASCVVSLRW